MKMGRLALVFVFTLSAWFGTARAGEWKLNASSLRWEETPSSLALLHGDQVLWKFNAGKEHAKPFFHPLAMVDGTVLTNLYPDDHPWHRGLWFSWKSLDKVDYWGEDRKTHQSWAGKTVVEKLKLKPNSDFSADLELELSYAPPGKEPVVREKRVIRVSAPTAAGDYAVDSSHLFTAEKDVLIDKNYYGGFSFRLNPGQKGWAYLNANGEPYRNKSLGKGQELNSEPTPWMCALEKRSFPSKGVALFDHPGNVRHPPQWCCISSFPYINPVFCYPEKLEMKKGDELKLRYQVQIFSPVESLAPLEQKYADFCRSK